MGSPHIENRIRESDYFVVLTSNALAERYNKEETGYVNKEIDLAHRKTEQR